MQTIQSYHDAFVTYLTNYVQPREPKALYEPIEYILQLGGKRLRPILTLMTADIFECDFEKAMDAALSIEVFHNFSLVHDDIMDAAPLRRGQETVHTRWDVNTAILSGDAMLIMAYQLFETYKPKTFRNLAKLFSKTALEVCEGQQYDVDFETRDDVKIEEYLKMIECKTAVLVAAAMKMGAIVADAPKECQDGIYDFGRNLGIAFQLQDDYLDAFGDPDTFGKQVGGDIIENKKTILYIKAIELSNVTDKRHLEHLFGITPTDPSGKIETIKQFFVSSGAAEATKQEISFYTEKAFSVLEQLSISEKGKLALRQFGEELMKRDV